MAKLLVPSGTLFHDNCGDTLSPMQFGFEGRISLEPATFFGIILPSSNVLDFSAKISAAFALAPTKFNANVTAALR
jgi:hypothetical protein